MESPVVFSCENENCSKTFGKRMDYNRHRKSHDRPHKCTICEKSFGLKTDRDRHKTTHGLNRSKFMCKFPRCRFKGASRQNYLWRHMQSSHGGIEDPISQMAIRRYYQEALNGIVSHAEDRSLDLLEAVSQGDENRVKGLLSMNASLLARNSTRTTVGDLAAAKGHVDILKVIFEAGVDANMNTTDPWLHQALRNGHITTAKFLIESGASVDAKSSENQTAFEEAVVRGSTDAISLLHQSGADIHPGSESQARLEEAIWYKDNYLELWYEHGVKIGEDPLQTTSTRTDIFTYYLYVSTNTSAAAKLMLDYGADIYGPSNPKNISSPRRERPAVEILWEYGSNIHEMPLSQNEPATTILSVMKYVSNGEEEIVQLLLEERSNPKGRHLWERILLHGMVGGEELVFRFLREWGPISVA